MIANLNLTKNFTVNQLIFSQTAIRLGLDNVPTKDVIDNLKHLSELVLEPLYSIFGNNMHISSGYRSIAINRALGSKDTSQHIKGQAVDIVFPRINIDDVIDGIKSSKIEYDQLINEFNQWVHISFDKNKKVQRMESFNI